MITELLDLCLGLQGLRLLVEQGQYSGILWDSALCTKTAKLSRAVLEARGCPGGLGTGAPESLKGRLEQKAFNS